MGRNIVSLILLASAALVLCGAVYGELAYAAYGVGLALIAGPFVDTGGK